jgi:biotin synthase
MISAREIADQARAAEAAGAREFSVVTSGTRLSRESELRTLEEALGLLAQESGMMRCASLGLMKEPQLVRLQKAGLQSLHHNLETARSHFDKVCSTHTYDEQLETIRAAKRLGLNVCSGGILGMGETPAQRVELAATIREVGADCVPVNFLNPRPGTPMEHVKAITAEECLAAIAVYRLMMPAAHIYVMGGREVNLADKQGLIFDAGADGTMVGNYLTSAGSTPDAVLGMIRGQGLEVRGPEGAAGTFTGEAPREAAWNTRALEGDRKRSLPVVR